jgi:hypothetical protein
MMMQTGNFWEIMQSFDAAEFTKIVRALTQAHEVLSGMPDKEPIPMEHREVVSGFFKTLETECLKLGLDMSAKTAERAATKLSKADSRACDYAAFAGEFVTRLEDEMQSRVFFCIEPRKQEFLGDRNLFGDTVAKAFPSARNDIKASGRCLALDQWTASVFHCMRVLEIGLTVLARKMRVPSDQTNWQVIIDNIENRIKVVEKKATKRQRKTSLKFYSGAATQFRYFKDAWRNHVAHVRDTYDEEDAERIFRSVRDFMVHLATQLKESSVT